MMTSTLTVKCAKCGTLMEVIHEGSTQGLVCPNCNWSVVTTRILEIQRDTESYEVRLSDGDYHNEQHVKVVAEIAGANFLTARKLLQETHPVVFIGKATEVVRAREILTTAGVTCAISPDFRW